MCKGPITCVSLDRRQMASRSTQHDHWRLCQSFGFRNRVVQVLVRVKNKVKYTLEQAMKARGGGIEVQLYSFFNLGAR